MKKILLLFSGGYESTVLLKLALELGYDVNCLTFDYGQVHKEEIARAVNICQTCNVPIRVMEIALPVNSVLLQNSGNVHYEGVSPYHIPSRNLVFVSIASGICESENLDTIWIGASYEDRVNQFPDCTQEWVVSVNNVLQKNGSFVIKLEAPLLGFTKELVKKVSEFLRIDDNLIFSGYGKE